MSKNYCRSVILIVDVTPLIRLEKPRGGLLRCLNFSDVNFVNVAVSNWSSSNYPFLMISIPRHYDLVCLIFFPYVKYRIKIVVKFHFKFKLS